MLNIVISFDYELYLGRNYYSPDVVLFEPTRKIIEILRKHQAVATFFADVCSVFRHREYGLYDYENSFVKQLREIGEAGLDAQLHIHSNWLTSTYEKGEWKFDAESYKLGSYPLYSDVGGWSVNSIIEKSVDFLNDTMKEVKSDYKCIAYRAGGFAIQPYNKIIPALQKNGILLDSSVVIGDFLESDMKGYDFRNVPNDKNWEIIGTEGNNQHSLFEIPILTEKNNFFKRVLTPGRKRGFAHGAATGEPIRDKHGNVSKKKQELRYLLNYNKHVHRVSMDSMNYHIIYDILRKVYAKANCKDKDYYAAIIGHPKAFTGDAFLNFENMLKLIKKDDRFKIMTMQDIARSLKKENR